MPESNHQDLHEQFTRILLENEPVVLKSILISVPNLNDAREIMQQTAVALWRKFETYNPERPFINWAMGYSRIETRRFLARQQRRSQLSVKAMEVLARETEEEPEEFRTITDFLRGCMSKLSRKQQRLIEGYYHDERSPKWLSEKEGSTVEAIYKIIQRTRQELQNCIERQMRKEAR
ncbi:MAG: sigma-70 family RNA polymerase sigma factor [Akkermansiaceae bacterium]